MSTTATWSKAADSSADPGQSKPLGVAPAGLVGKVLRRMQRSDTHPALTLYFTDNTAYQVRVDGYNPAHPGLPKEIELDGGFDTLLRSRSAEEDLNLTVIAATMTNMRDRGLQLSERQQESTWIRGHAGIALKFKEQANWHVISVTVEERDKYGRCIFRNFEDVYLDKLERRPRVGRNGGGARTKSRTRR